MTELMTLYQNHRGKVTDRWQSYVRTYEALLQPLRDKPLRLLEIGIQNGGSLEVWARYFPRAELLVGCDIDPLCANLSYADPRIAVVVADANTDTAQSRIESLSPRYELVIEDGSHRSGDIVRTFARYFPLVTDGGSFIAEDLHCGYWREFEGGLGDPLSSVAFFQRLAHLINHEHWGVPIGRTAYLEGFAQYYGCQFDESALADVHSVQFLNSICIVQKRSAIENRLGPRMIVGTQEDVTQGARAHHDSFSRALDQRDNAWSDARVVNLADGDRFAARFAIVEERARHVGADAVGQTNRAEALERRVAELADALVKRDSAMAEFASERVYESLRLEREAHEQRAYVGELIGLINARDAQVAALNAAARTKSARFGRALDRAARRVIAARKSAQRRLASLRGRAPALIGSTSVAHSLAMPTEGAVVALDARAQPHDFAEWIRAHEPGSLALKRQREAAEPFNAAAPLFSVLVPIYKIPAGVLRATIASLQQQSWQNWEACLAYADLENDENWALLEAKAAADPRLVIRRLDENGGISRNSNAALAFARGEFIVLLDHDDELTPWALHDMAAHIRHSPTADFLYSDKDSIDASGATRMNPLFKPDWSPEMMYSVNYLTHLNVMRRQLVQEVGGWRPETDGAQDWDIFLRVCDRSRRIERVPGIHYHWRIIAGSTATGIGAKPYAALGQLRTLESHVQRQGLHASVLPNRDSGFRLVWALELRPSVDLIFHGYSSLRPASLINAALVETMGLLASVSFVTGPNVDETALPDYLPASIALRKTRVDDEIAMTSAIEDAVSATSAGVVLLIDLSISRFGRRALQDLIGWALLHPQIGFASALVLLGDDTVVEAGRVAGDELRTQPLFRATPLRHWGPLGGPLWYRNVSAAAPTAVAVARPAWDTQGQRGVAWPQAFAGHCAASLLGGRRGMVSPHARVYLDRMPDDASDPWHDSFRADPYFHPAFVSVSPLILEGAKP